MKLSDVPWRPPTPGLSSYSRWAQIDLPKGHRIVVGECIREPNTFCALTPDTPEVIDLDAFELQCLLYHYLGGNDASEP